jgi:hypothetical protein
VGEETGDGQKLVGRVAATNFGSALRSYTHPKVCSPFDQREECSVKHKRLFDLVRVLTDE